MGNSNLTQTCNQDISQSCQQNSGLTQQEIEGIKNVFNSLYPKDGVISTETLRKLYRDSYDAPKLQFNYTVKKLYFFYSINLKIFWILSLIDCIIYIYYK